MSKELPFMRFWIADYMRDTSDLTFEQHGVYMHLLWFMWEEGGWLADNDIKIATRLGVPRRKWLGFRADLSKYLTVYGPPGDRRITQKRLQIEYNKAIEHAKKRSDIGSKAAKARYDKAAILHNGMHHASITQSIMPASHKERIIPTTYQEDRSAEDSYTGIHRLLQTPAMKRTA